MDLEPPFFYLGNPGIIKISPYLSNKRRHILQVKKADQSNVNDRIDPLQ